jgi:tripartite-type tricarboxylate transporter receptor subunit TctC
MAGTDAAHSKQTKKRGASLAQTVLHVVSVAVSVLLAFVLGVGDARSQSFPNKPLRMIVPFPASGGADIFARLVSRKIAEQMGQGVVVDNRAGASGIIGSEAVAKAAPDGYTLLLGTTGTHSTNPAVYAKLPYDPIRDYVAVSLVAEAPFALLVHPSLPVRTVKELIAFAKARPGQLNYGSAGIGSSSHLGFEQFNLMAGIKTVHVPYKGLPLATGDTIAGNLTMTWDSISAAGAMIRAQRLRALGIGSLKRSSLMPELPSISEAGLPGFELVSWYGIFAPAGTPTEVVKRLNGEIVRAVVSPELREQYAALGATQVSSTPEDFAAMLKRDIAKWGKVARDVKIEMQ